MINKFCRRVVANIPKFFFCSNKNITNFDIKDVLSVEPDKSNIVDGEGSKYVLGDYIIKFTCNKCEHRQQKQFTRNAYENGVVIIRCDSCKNLHLIADNLKWFEDSNTNIEQIMQEKGEALTKLTYKTSWEIKPETNSIK